MTLPRASLICLGLTYLSSFTLGGVVQKSALSVPGQYQSNLATVGDIFDRSYAAYWKYARGHDDLLPLTKSFADYRNGWGASLVDAMSTMKIMGRDDLYNQAVEEVSRINFNQSNTPETVSVFETTIRYLGGLLSAYELNDEKDGILLEKAKELADKLAFAWRDGNIIPYRQLNFSDNTPVKDTSNIAEAGTLTLEWTTLSKYTNDSRYQQLAENAVRHIAALPTPLPGLPAQGIDPVEGSPVGGYVTWGGGSDSYFEYLIKYARLTNTADPLFADTWATAIDSSIKTLLKTSVGGKYAYLADYDDQQNIRHIGSHLACFYGGNWLLGGCLMNNHTMLDIGRHLVDSCWNTYASTATGIGPETFAFISADGNYTGGDPPTAEQLDFNSKHGFYITSSDYILRPEVLESNFYAWRITGDPVYLERAAQAVDSFKKYLTTDEAYAGLVNVDNRISEKIDDMESFWFAEVLKYLYLTFDDPARFSLDKYVFNTEAHPFKLPEPKPTYGTGTPIQTAPNDTPFHVTGGDLPQVSQVPDLQSYLQHLLGSL